MSRMSEAEQATRAAVQGLAASRPVRKEPDDPPPPTPEAVERVKIGLQSFKEAMAGPANPSIEAARKIRQAEVDGRRAAHEEHSRRMQYIVQGFEPITGSNGKTLSMSLARSIGVELTPRKPAPAPNDGFILPAEEGGQA